jgi:hypothetical protein
MRAAAIPVPDDRARAQVEFSYTSKSLPGFATDRFT